MILCCGEALIDMLPARMRSGQEGFVPHPGGAVFNTAVGLGRLGVPAGLLSGLSTDRFGQQLLAALKASHVDVSAVILSNRPTTLAFADLPEGAAGYSFFDENSAGRMLRLSDMPGPDAAVSTLFLGGISLACEPCGTAYEGVLDREGGSRLVMLDPNIRPDFAQDEAGYRARLDRMIRRSDILKVSDEDLGWILPQEAPLSEKIAALLKMGPSLVVLTLGPAGAAGYLRDGTRVAVPAPQVQVADTVGAGDAFNAGLLAELSRLGLAHRGVRDRLDRNTLERTLSFAVRVAALSVARAGAHAPWASEVDP